VSIPNSLGLCQATNDSDANGSAEKLVFFENKIRPVLVEHCYACHSQEAVTKGKLKANLFLDSREGMVRGGDTGPSIVPGKPNDSLLLKALHYEDYEMPPSGKLPASILENFERWIADGAADPRRGNEPLKQQRMDLEAGRQFWSLQPLRSVHPPGASHPIDAFIHAELAKKQISPSPTADARVLVRRAWFDLLGLPPTPQELQHALETLQPRSGETGPLSLKGWNEVIDGLLERPEYGERWARHWMDVVRFAESFGYEQDYDRPTAYHYRDFLIRAFNEDMPFDQFTRWQIAGDELAPEKPLAWMATGFLGAGAFPTQLTEREFESARYDELDDMTATTGVAFLGLSIGCARCHDHKFDPISSEDYYRFASSFTTAIRSEKTFDLQPEENEKKKVQHAEDLQELRERLAQFDARELVAIVMIPKRPIPPSLRGQPFVETSSRVAAANSDRRQMVPISRWVRHLPTRSSLSSRHFLPGNGHRFVSKHSRIRRYPTKVLAERTTEISHLETCLSNISLREPRARIQRDPNPR
jgi:hypothetical protein